MEGEDVLRTVECLRGRLLAERQASRAAEENAELVGRKLRELEEQLRIETKAWKKAEKKLNFLKRKLESLNISYISEESEPLTSAENCESSFISSSSSDGSKDPKEGESEIQTTDSMKFRFSGQAEKTNSPILSQNLEHKFQDTGDGNPSLEDPSYENLKLIRKSADSKTVSMSIEGPCCENLKSNKKSADSEVDKSGSLKSSTMAMENYEHNFENDMADHCVDNSTALVPVSLPKGSEIPPKTELKITIESVTEVLDRLKNI
ncbi:hypothetical protein Nepgr_024947 [Nepenthes gracilis]|uniref:Uncharacterized protein n=1 Tax=Nepenthes gracilis TaxID=150966 RepID=A0AAD3T610_NEPGR|nr:hypothetical protein Nepgr_024947 [Nepenthes gracilis]